MAKPSDMAKKRGVGQSAASLAARKAANKGVAAGTVRKGAGGKYMRKYNAKTGRWDIVGATAKTAAKYVAQKKATANKTTTRRDVTSAEGPKRSMPVTTRTVDASKKSTAGTYTQSYARPKTPGMAQPTSPKGQLAQLQRALGFQMAAKRNTEARKQKTATDAANLRKINAEIARLKKALGR